ncbi:flagellar assembly protein FliX [Roseiterribacter gracilis]|uniref:Flagellar assembly protein FliX n=1 Tax=Roseiterribacter gracilis TaxID=2812848 RepID=A0A8S8XIL0_9PROT|nr:flagellar assembly protein FliX [Rhodospirillales bacterium TMPK1]
MSVDGVGRIRNQPAGRTNKTSGTGGSDFARLLEGESGETTPVSAGAPVGAVSGLLAVQQAGDPLEGRRRARRRAHDMLSELEGLVHGLLDDDLPAERLEALAALAKSERAEVDDPELAELLDQIELRVQVELAKRGRSTI